MGVGAKFRGVGVRGIFIWVGALESIVEHCRGCREHYRGIGQS